MKTMNDLSSMLRQAYKLMADANTNDIDDYMLAIEEAHGFVAEALDLAEDLEGNL